MSVGKTLAEAVLENSRKVIAHDEDPKNRTVRKVVLEHDEQHDVYQCFIVSDCCTFAEETKLLCVTGVKPSEEKINSALGKNEIEAYDIIFNKGIDELVRCLDKLYEGDYKFDVCSDGCTYFDTNNEDFVDYVLGLCNAELITYDGGCNYLAHRELDKHGYDVFAGEKDSFGWLTGCVQKQGSDKILVYG